MKPLKFVFAATLAASLGGTAIAQGATQGADPFAVSQAGISGAVFGLAPTVTVVAVTVVTVGVLSLTILNDDGTTSTTTVAVP